MLNFIFFIQFQDSDEDDEGKGKLHPRDIDAFWLQREIAKFVDDAMVAQNRAKEVIEILQVGFLNRGSQICISQNTSDDRECENQLVLLLGFDEFDFIRVLRAHRLTVLYCTLLAQAQTADERATVEARMEAAGEATQKILVQLRDVHEKDVVGTEKAKMDKARTSKREAEAKGEGRQAIESGAFGCLLRVISAQVLRHGLLSVKCSTSTIWRSRRART